MTMIAREGTNSAGRAAGFGCLISSFSAFLQPSPLPLSQIRQLASSIQESNRHRCRLETAVSRCKQTSATSSNRPSIAPLGRANLPASLPPSRLLQHPASGLQHLDSHYNAGVPIKLIAMDLDGTLLDSASQLPRENAVAIEEAAAQGLEIVIVIGHAGSTRRAPPPPASHVTPISSPAMAR